MLILAEVMDGPSSTAADDPELGWPDAEQVGTRSWNNGDLSKMNIGWTNYHTFVILISSYFRACVRNNVKNTIKVPSKMKSLIFGPWYSG